MYATPDTIIAIVSVLHVTLWYPGQGLEDLSLPGNA